MKEEPAQCKEPKFLGKAGWVKKAPGRLLASYKDRYIHVEKTEIVVYENEVHYSLLISASYVFLVMQHSHKFAPYYSVM